METSHQQQERSNQERRKIAPKFVSAGQPKPKTSFAQGPDGSTGFQTPRCPVTTESKVFTKKVQCSVKTEFLTLKQYEDYLNNPKGRPALGQKMCPLPDTFGRDTGRYVTYSPPCFSNGLQKKTDQLERTGKIKPTRAGGKSTFKFPDGTSPLACILCTSLKPGGHVPTANTVQPSRERKRTPAPTYSWGQRWANANDSNDDDSFSSLAEKETTEAEEERMAQCWLRDTSLESQLKVSASQFYPSNLRLRR